VRRRLKLKKTDPLEGIAVELLTAFTRSKRLNLYSGFILALAYAVFASAHLVSYRRSHDWTLLLFCISEAIVIIFLIFRTIPQTVSTVRLDWVVGIAGTFIPMLLRPASWGILPLAKYAIAVGLVLQVAGLLSLNRSLAIVAAKREIKTGGLYRFVRHPLYAAYVLMYSGYVLNNTTLANLTIYVVMFVLLMVRVFREEAHLALDPHYRDYMRRVPYRIIPFVF
jgi:protein-S-isoprenylcysteine O-methyltransferase Ste14